MEAVERNKQFIRDHIQEQDQEEFFEYFMAKPNSEAFETWSHEQTAQVFVSKMKVVQEFHHMRKLAQHHPPETASSPVKEPITSFPEPKHFATSLGILQQMEKEQGITPVHSFSTQSWAPHERTIDWLNMGEPVKKTP